MDNDFIELHTSVLNEVNKALNSINLNMRIGNIRKTEQPRYFTMRNALTLWKETYGEPSSDEDVVEGIVMLNSVLKDLK